MPFGFGERLLVLGLLLLLFGAKKLPELARGLGAGIRNFKGEIKAPPDKDPGDDDEPKSLRDG